MTVRAAAARSENPDPRAAAREAAQAARAALSGARPALVIAFATPPFAAPAAILVEALRDAADGAPVAGCIGGGVVSGSDELEGGAPALVVLAVAADDEDELAVRVLAHRGSPTGVEAEVAAARAVRDALSAPPDRTLHVLMPCPIQFDAGAHLAALRDQGVFVPTVGGAGVPAEGERRAVAFAGDEVVEGGAASILIAGRGLRPLVACAQGCRPIVPVGRVTAAAGNVIREIDDRPAVERLAAAVAAAQKREGVRALFAAIGLPGLAAPSDAGDFLIRHVGRVDRKDGSIAIGAPVESGRPITFAVLDPEGARADLAARIDEVAAPFARPGAAPPAFGLLFECLGRGAGLYGATGEDAGAVARRLGKIPLVGFFGNAEIAPLFGANYVHAYTAVLAIVAPSASRS